MKRLAFQGWLSLALWMSFGLLLESLMAYKSPAYLDDPYAIMAAPTGTSECAAYNGTCASRGRSLSQSAFFVLAPVL